MDGYHKNKCWWSFKADFTKEALLENPMLLARYVRLDPTVSISDIELAYVRIVCDERTSPDIVKAKKMFRRLKSKRSKNAEYMGILWHNNGWNHVFRKFSDGESAANFAVPADLNKVKIIRFAAGSCWPDENWERHHALAVFMPSDGIIIVAQSQELKPAVAKSSRRFT